MNQTQRRILAVTLALMALSLYCPYRFVYGAQMYQSTPLITGETGNISWGRTIARTVAIGVVGGAVWAFRKPAGAIPPPLPSQTP